MVSVTVFIVIFVFVLVLVAFSSKKPLKELQSETVALATAVQHDPDYSLVEEGRVDKERFAALASMNYTELKKKLGLKNDFCIYIEDAEGDLLPVRIGDKNFTGIGNGSGITVGGEPCGE